MLLPHLPISADRAVRRFQKIAQIRESGAQAFLWDVFDFLKSGLVEEEEILCVLIGRVFAFAQSIHPLHCNVSKSTIFLFNFLGRHIGKATGCILLSLPSESYI